MIWYFVNIFAFEANEIFVCWYCFCTLLLLNVLSIRTTLLFGREDMDLKFWWNWKHWILHLFTSNRKNQRSQFLPFTDTVKTWEIQEEVNMGRSHLFTLNYYPMKMMVRWLWKRYNITSNVIGQKRSWPIFIISLNIQDIGSPTCYP